MDQDMANELVNGFLSVMPGRLNQIILYGSVARGSSSKDSDIDIALIVKDKLDGDTEDRLSDFIVDRFTAWKMVIPFYQNVSREGVVLWKAA